MPCSKWRSAASEYYRGNYTIYLRSVRSAGSIASKFLKVEKEKLLKEVEYIKKNISGQNTLQAKGKLKRLDARGAGHRTGRHGRSGQHELVATGCGDDDQPVQRGGSRTTRARASTASTHHAGPGPASAFDAVAPAIW